MMRMRIRILCLVKVMQICDHWSTDSPRLHFTLPLLASKALQCSIFEPPQLLNFDFDADPAFDLDAELDSSFHFDTDPDLHPPALVVVLANAEVGERSD